MVKTRMQLETGKSPSLVTSFRNIVREEGCVLFLTFVPKSIFLAANASIRSQPLSAPYLTPARLANANPMRLGSGDSIADWSPRCCSKLPSVL